MKQCTKCGLSKPLSDYHLDKRKKDGRYSACKACHYIAYKKWHTTVSPEIHLAYATNWRYKRRLRAIEYLGNKCLDCGYSKNPDGLEFDHIQPRNGRISLLAMNRSWESLVKELNKCELVCGTCHNIRTARRRRECS
jgi:hypothetical protein